MVEEELNDEEVKTKEPEYEYLRADEVQAALDCFDRFDKNGEGSIEVDALGTFLRYLNHNPTNR